MQFPNPKIKFYKIRTFGEKFNIAFDFLRETWKTLLKFSLYLILPICLVQAFAMNAYMRFAFSLGAGDIGGGSMAIISTFLMNYGVLMICLMVGSCMLASLVYTLMQEYERRESRLMEITFEDFKDPFLRNTGKMIKASLFFIVAFIIIMVVFGLLLAMSPWTMVITIPLLLIGLFIISMPLSLFTPMYIFEDKPFAVALKRAFRYGFSAWGEIFVIVLVFGLLGGIISSITMMPWYIMIMIKSVFSLSGDNSGITASLGYDFIVYILGIVQSYGTYLSAMISAVGIAFQYFHIREKKEGLSVNENIANFDRL